MEKFAFVMFLNSGSAGGSSGLMLQGQRLHVPLEGGTIQVLRKAIGRIVLASNLGQREFFCPKLVLDPQV